MCGNTLTNVAPPDDEVASLPLPLFPLQPGVLDGFDDEEDDDDDDDEDDEFDGDDELELEARAARMAAGVRLAGWPLLSSGW